MKTVTYYAMIVRGKECIRNGGKVDCDEYSLRFPDVLCAYTCADTREEAIRRGTIELEFALTEGVTLGERIQAPSTIEMLKHNINRPDIKDFLEGTCGYEFVPITVNV